MKSRLPLSKTTPDPPDYSLSRERRQAGLLLIYSLIKSSCGRSKCCVRCRSAKEGWLNEYCCENVRNLLMDFCPNIFVHEKFAKRS